MHPASSSTSPLQRIQTAWRWAIRPGGGGWSVPPLLALILLLAFLVRIYGVGWDQNGLFHPDERSVYLRTDCMYRLLVEAPGWESCTQDDPFQQAEPGFPSLTVFLDADKSPLNPHWFPLGSIILYVMVGIKLLASPFFTMELRDLAMAGRLLSTLADVGTVAMVYLLGKRLYSKNAGLLAAALVAFAVVHIQHSHYYRPETFSNLFTLASFWFMMQVLEKNRIRDSAFLGLFIGLAFATKISMAPILISLAALYGRLFLGALRKPAHATLAGAGRADPPDRPALMEKAAMRALLGGFIAIAVYLLWTPYSVLAFPEFLYWNLRELDIVRNAGSVPYTVQYIGAPKLGYELRQTITWGLGYPLGLLAWGGFLAAIVINLRRPRWGQVLILLWAVSLLIIVARVDVKFLRYTFPLMPVIILMGAGTALMGVDWLKRHKPAMLKAAQIALGAILGATVFYGLAFQAVYSSPHTAVQTSRWINANIPEESFILTDNHWDEGVPDLGRYRLAQVPIFEGDTIPKINSMAANLSEADYLLFYSNRTYGAVARAPERYPYSSNYYALLFSGALGYQLDESFSAYPSLLGISLVDDPFRRAGIPMPNGLDGHQSSLLSVNMGYADNDHITYDHPLVMLFKNTGRLDKDALASMILNVEPGPDRPLQLLLTQDELAAQRNGGTWSEIFNPSGLSNRLPILVWLALLQLASLAILPIGFLLFRGLHDRGYLLSKTMAVLLLAYLPWLLAALNILDFTRLSIYLGLAGMAAAGAFIAVTRRDDILAFLKARWRILALEEVLFLAAFLVFLALRWANPDLWHPFRGGEKPMDFAYLNAVIHSSSIPPYDPWFAGGYLNYYYFGQFILATLIKATGILPEVAFNLAVPLLFALTAGGAFSIVYNLTSAMRQRSITRLDAHRQVHGEETPLSSGSGPSWGPVAAGIAGILLVAVLSNLGAAVQLARAGLDKLRDGTSFPMFDYWAPSRMIPDQIAITEFPFWTFLFADPHAHMIVIPFTLLAAGLSLSLVLDPGALSSGWKRAVMPLAVLGIAAGSLAAINTWDYPTYMALGIAGIFIACYAHYKSLSLAFLKSASLKALFAVAVSYVTFLPFHSRFVAFSAGIHSSNFQTPMQYYLGIHALFLFIVVSYLAYESFRYLKLQRMNEGGEGSAKPVSKLVWPLSPGRIALAVGSALFLFMLAAYLTAGGYGTVAFLFALTVTAAVLGVRRLLDRGDSSLHHLFILVLVIGALGLGITVDLVTANNDIDRMNTIFKLYLQAWVLYALASAAILWYLMTSARISWCSMTWGKGIWAGLLTLLVLSVSIFPVLGTRSRLADRFDTGFTSLNGAAFMEKTEYSDAEGPIELKHDWDAIQWLRREVQGSPVIAEGSTEPHRYRWGGRFSIYTGLPSIVGWSWHQIQQRHGEQFAVGERLSDLNTLYTTTNATTAAAVLRRYNVEYIIVGELERLYYPAPGLAKFETLTDQGVVKVYSNAQVDIYRVDDGREDAAA